MRIVREKCTGLIIDLQERLFPVMAEHGQLLQNCQKLITGFQLLGIPTIATQQYTKGLGATLAEIKSLTEPFEFIEKSSFSCLDEPLYEAYLSNSGRNTVLICGIEAHVCVLQSAIDLQDKGYQPIIVSDCISSRNLHEKQIALQRFATEGIRVSTTESLLFELTRSSTATEFRSISKLIK